MSRGRIGVIECGEKTYAVHGHLRDAVDFLWLWQTRSFQDCRCDVGAMSELTSETAFVLDAFGPANDHWITNATEM
jgi:hypothetical protein